MADAYTQAERRFAVKAPTGQADLLLLREMTAVESISGDCHMQLSLLSQDANIKFEDMIGGALSIRMDLPEGGGAKTRIGASSALSSDSGCPPACRVSS